ncbi:MAG: hypothetical protein V4671_08020 [Armatimonadota bacterium]
MTSGHDFVPDPALLHDRATRGETLSPAEQAALDAWYADSDRAESETLGQESASVADDVAVLRAQVAAAQEKLYKSIDRVRQISDENEQMRQEIAQMRSRLTAPLPQAA